jgi:hypothetical protein
MRTSIAVAFFTGILLAPSAARADALVPGQIVQLHTYSPSVTGGGPMWLDVGNALLNFLTFCLESGIPETRDVDLKVNAIKTETSGFVPNDPISPRTAFWYWRFRSGDPTYSGTLVQWMIWCEEGETDCTARPSIRRPRPSAMRPTTI